RARSILCYTITFPALALGKWGLNVAPADVTSAMVPCAKEPCALYYPLTRLFRIRYVSSQTLWNPMAHHLWRPYVVVRWCSWMPGYLLKPLWLASLWDLSLRGTESRFCQILWDSKTTSAIWILKLRVLRKASLLSRWISKRPGSPRRLWL